MKHFVKLLAALCFISLSVFVAMAENTSATQQSIMIDKSLSPDESKYLTIKDKDPDGSEGVALGTANVINVATGKSLGSFDWAGFGYHPDKNAFKVLWRADSKAFAISWEISRGFVTNAVFCRYRDGWVKVDLPKCYSLVKNFSQDDGGKHVTIYPGLGGKGHEVVKEWLPDNKFCLEASYRDIGITNRIDREQLFSVIYHIENSDGKIPPKVVLEKVELSPES